MTHPAQHLVDASKKRQREWVEGRARGGRADRPGKKGALRGGASEDEETQSDSMPPLPHIENEKAPIGRAEGGRLTAEKRRAMPSKDFALPGKGDGPRGKGSGSYPIPDESHARNALARGAQHASPEELAMIKRKVHEKFPGIKEG